MTGATSVGNNATQRVRPTPNYLYVPRGDGEWRMERISKRWCWKIDITVLALHKSYQGMNRRSTVHGIAVGDIDGHWRWRKQSRWLHAPMHSRANQRSNKDVLIRRGRSPGC